ncbi:MAG: DUF2240 family protein [Halobacteriales archaeon]|nr:DUF2240 family protein [Halobacteriales archaeon]
MSLRRVVGAPFVRRDTDEVTRTEFVYSLTGDLGWFDPDEAEKTLEVGVEKGLLVSDGDGLRVGFDATSVGIPDGWSPDMDSLETEVEAEAEETERGVFERAVERLVGTGYEKREAVAEINRLHAEMGDARIEAVALVVAKREGLRVSDLADEALEELLR